MDKPINYITDKGYDKLLEELIHLQKIERPETTKIIAWAASNGDRSENADYIYGKKRLREIDRRVRFLSKRLENVKIINPIEIKSDTVLFGATVFFRENEEKKKLSIVGVDEVDINKGNISWRSPIGRALIGKKNGDLVEFNTPNGERELEVLEIIYMEII